MKKALVVGLNKYPGCSLDWCDNDAIAVASLIAANGDGSPKACKLTALGLHYWKLSKDRRF